MDSLLAVAGETPVLDDAAHALPAMVGNRPVGSVATLTAFSFYATKNLTTGEGGMLTGPVDLTNKARDWILHGMTRDAYNRNAPGGSWRYDVTRAGFKYNLSDVLAAIGLVQLARLDGMHARRRALARLYADGLRDLEELQLPAERPGTSHSWHIYAVRLHLERLTIDRGRFIDELAQRKIGTSVHFIPVHTLTYYRDKYGFRRDDFPVASREFDRLVSLPLHSRMTDDDVADVIQAVTDVIKLYRR
jgi:dTDP-4-amino-4,6-dideoxygalactose transaminase